jgi:hypothetical protein
MSKRYLAKDGFFDDGAVFVEDSTVPTKTRLLEPRLDLRNHSPTGFGWGYGGSGPAQLALAILCDLFDDEFAQENYQEFKRDVIAGLEQNSGWVLTEEEIRSWREEH